MIAAILGHLLRCLYVKGGQFQDIGRVKASWVADTFGVGLRRVKEARRELVALGWLIPLPSPQWAMNRWGALVRIDLSWSRQGGTPAGSDGPLPTPESGPELAPPAPPSGTEPAPLDFSDEEPLQGDKNQEPAAGGPAGFSISHSQEKTSEAEGRSRDVVSASLPAVPGKPDLRHVVPEDLADTGRLLELYAQAVALGLVPASEWGRLRFVAAAEHARLIGKANRCGLFAGLVRAGALHYATEGDEEAASARLRRHLYGGSPPSRPSGQGGIVRMVPELSDDARLVQAVRAAAARAGYRGDPFPLLKRQRPDWTRDRWDRVLEELDGRTETARAVQPIPRE
jgi:hypothetical protein